MHILPRIVGVAAVAAAYMAAADARRTVEISFIATAGVLSASDLKLTDNGRDQPITALWKVTPGQIPLHLPPHTFTNRGEAAQNVSVVFLDGVNTEWRNDAAGREELTRALQQIKPDDRVAILVFGKTLRVLSDFSDSAAERAAKIQQFPYSDLVLPVNLRSVSARFTTVRRHLRRRATPTRASQPPSPRPSTSQRSH